MESILRTLCILWFGFCSLAVSAAEDPVAVELDALWAQVSRTVADGDFDAYAGVYHPDAVLVSEINGTSYPIAAALRGWREGFDDTRAGTIAASVEFRFTKRLHDATTAHETGLFRYVSRTPGGSSVEQILHFEALLVKKDGWKILMEFQKSLAAQAEWASAGSGSDLANSLK
jgi:ketosteroid isomerase-like protein